MNWLITGGCGFIGRSLIKELTRSSDENNVRIIDNLSGSSIEDLEKITSFKIITSPKKDFKNIELVIADIQDIESAISYSAGADVIVHLAANTGVQPSVDDPISDCRNNVIGTLNFLESARINKIKNFIFASSGAPVGEVNPPIKEDLAASPVSPYGASKLAGEAYCSAYYKTFGIDTIALRFSNVYGPDSHKKSSVIAKFLKNYKDNQVIKVYGDGSQTRDFIYITDLIQAIVLSVEMKDIGGNIFQIASGLETSINELIERMNNSLIFFGKSKLTVSYKEKRVGDVSRNFSDISKAKKILNWSPKIKLDEGLIKTMEFFFDEKFKE